jgi:hypothetical protein
MAENFIPGAEGLFHNWEINLISYASSRYKTWGVPDDRWKNLLALQSTYHTRYDTANNPATSTHAAIKMRQEARKTYESALREIIKSYITYNLLVNDEDRIDMGLPIHDTKPTRVEVPKDFPEHELDLSIIRRLIIYFFAAGMKRTSAKPYGIRGAGLFWAILDHAPLSIDELIHSSFATRSPFLIDFVESDRGKRVYFCLVWENTRGEKGPWSEIVMAVIP